MPSRSAVLGAGLGVEDAGRRGRRRRWRGARSRSPGAPRRGSAPRRRSRRRRAGSASRRRRRRGRAAGRGRARRSRRGRRTRPAARGRRHGRGRVRGPCQILSGTMKVATGGFSSARARRPRARDSRTWNAAVLQPAARAASAVDRPSQATRQIASRSRSLSAAKACARPRSPLMSSAGIAGRGVGREHAAARRLAPVVGEHVARDGVEPGEGMLEPARQLAPRDGERLGGEILGLVTRRPGARSTRRPRRGGPRRSPGTPRAAPSVSGCLSHPLSVASHGGLTA